MSDESRSASPTRSFLLGLSGAGLLGLVGLCLLVVGVGGYLYLNRGSTAAEPAVQYVLDVSPRMMLPVAGGEGTRLAAAQAVLAEVVRPSDPALTSGFRVFGSDAAADPCRDTRLLIPMARSNQPQIADSILSVEAGASPGAALAGAMIAALQDLARSRGPHTLVVVTGGADSCNTQAAALIAQEAERAGVRVQQFVIGFQVTAEDAEAIKAMVAQAAGATYYDAPDANALRTLLQSIQQVLTQPLAERLAIVVPATAAPTETAPPPTPTEEVYVSETACDHPYFPLRTGATWTYSSGGESVTWEVSEVSGDLNSATASVIITVNSTALTYEWPCTAEGVVHFTTRAMGSQGFATTYELASHSGATLLSADGLESGATWESTYRISMTDEAEGFTMTNSLSVSGAHSAGPVERLSTALGTFDVIPIATDSSTTTTTSVDGSDPFSSSDDDSHITYVAKGIGILRVERGGETAMALVGYRAP